MLDLWFRGLHNGGIEILIAVVVLVAAAAVVAMLRRVEVVLTKMLGQQDTLNRTFGGKTWQRLIDRLDESQYVDEG